MRWARFVVGGVLLVALACSSPEGSPAPVTDHPDDTSCLSLDSLPVCNSGGWC
jgi:hypothetical protein